MHLGRVDIELIGGDTLAIGMWLVSRGGSLKDRLMFTAAALLLGFLLTGFGAATVAWVRNLF